MNIACDECGLICPVGVMVCDAVVLCPRCADELERELVEQEGVE